MCRVKPMSKSSKITLYVWHVLKRFFNRTSFHGFYEFYHAKWFVWRVIWLLVCIGAILVTGYQVYKAILEYISDASITVILPAEEDSILYPSFSLCLWNWYYWMDWKKASTYNVTKEALLYAFNFYDTIYSPSFDIVNAREEFKTMMDERNISTLTEFYFSVAREVPIFDDNCVKPFFDRKKIVSNADTNMLCYLVSEKRMQQFFAQNSNVDQPKLITFKIFDETYNNFSEMVSLDEHRYYVLRWMEKFSMYTVNWNNPALATHNFSQFIPPNILIVIGDIVKGTQIQNDNDAYLLELSASAYTWQNKWNKVCIEGKQSLTANNKCQQTCRASYELKSCSCQMLNTSYYTNRTDTLENLCQNGFVFYDNSSALERGQIVANQSQNCSTNVEQLNAYYSCVSKCAPSCQIWNYQKTITTKSTSTNLRSVGTKRATSIRVEYPIGKDIVVMTETDSRSWEMFIGNVGGLLGIWTGASILSFIQMLYLCCFVDHDG